APRERLVLELFLDARDLQVLQAARRSDQGAGHQEAAQLVHREERPGHRGVTRHASVVRVPEDGASACLREPERGENAYALGGGLLGGGGGRGGAHLLGGRRG